MLKKMVTIYSTGGCPLCLMVKSYLRDLGIIFEEKDAEGARELLFRRGFTHVPILEIDGVWYAVTSLDSLGTILKDHNVK